MLKNYTQFLLLKNCVASCFLSMIKQHTRQSKGSGGVRLYCWERETVGTVCDLIKINVRLSQQGEEM